MFHRVYAFNLTVSKHETLGCSQFTPSSRLQEASCAPAVVRAAEWGVWWHVTDKWGVGGSEGDRGAGQWREEKRQHVEVKITKKHFLKEILNPDGVWEAFAKVIAEYTVYYIRRMSVPLWANRFENCRNGSFCPICVPITDKWAKRLDINEYRNISNCYSLHWGKVASHSGYCGYFSEDISIINTWV